MVEASEVGAWKVGGIKGQSLVGASTAARDGNGLDLGWVEKIRPMMKLIRVRNQTYTRR
jgi:hypothetical protein